MTEIITAFGTYPFLQKALLAGVLASVACGIIGTYVVTKRITYIGGGIAHSLLAGMGLAYFLSISYDWSFFKPIYGAVIAALLAAIIIGLVTLKARQREDSVISAVWAVGFAVGIIFIAKTPGYNQDLMSYLFGNILMITNEDLWLIAGLDILVVGLSVLFYRQFLAVCFDEEFARTQGLNTDFYYLLLLCLIALTVVIMVAVVGIVMVIALLTLPSGLAAYFAGNIRKIMAISIILSILFSATGLVLSYSLNLPSGATIIVFSGMVFLAGAIFSYVRSSLLKR